MLQAEVFRAIEQLKQLAAVDAVNFVAGSFDLRTANS
jgi:hypothetical protein